MKSSRAAVWGMAGPLILSSVGQAVLATSDTAVVGQLGRLPLAALGIAWPFYFVSFVTLAGFRNGAQVLLAQRFGARDATGVARIVHNTCLVSGLLALGLAALFIGGGPTLVRLLSPAPELNALGAEYLWLRGLSLLPLVPTGALIAFFTGIGRAHVNASHTLVTAVVHVPAAIVLVLGSPFGPGLGLNGAAVAGIMSNTAGLVYLLWLASRKDVRGHGLFGRLQIDRVAAGVVLRISGPEAAMLFFMTIANVLFVKVASLLGTTEVAAAQVLIAIENMLYTVCVALMATASVLVGQRLGAADQAGARAIASACIRDSLMVGVLLVLPLLAVPQLVLRVFASDPMVIDIAEQPLRLLAVSFPIGLIGMVQNGIIKGTGDTPFVFWGTTIPSYILRVGYGYLAGVQLGGGLLGAQVGVVLYAVVRVVVTTLRVRRGIELTARSRMVAREGVGRR